MSVTDVTARVQELQALISRPIGQPETAVTPVAFASRLQAATTSAPVAPAAGGGDTSYDTLIQDAARRNGIDPAQSIEGGAKYLAQQLKTFNGDASLALAAYNAGPGAVQRAGGIPPYAETQNYVQKVLGYANAYRGSLA